ncbi:MAG TPA: CPBP family intramembrane metalloprotease [Deltaproteobacteria bacterium]|nr:CPBP family intramembrane metalloprotease [Deltaproteobacteria bacterium]
MDRPILAIIAVCLVEALMRLAYPCFTLDGLTYTLIARMIQLFIILGLCRGQCGIEAPAPGRELLIGLGIAAGFGACVLCVDVVARLFIPGGIIIPIIGRPVVKDPLLYLLVGCIFAPLVEELFFRGIIYGWIRRRQSAPVAVLVSAVLFASMHGFLSPVQLIGGVAFALIYEWRRSIWAAYVLHCLANAGIWLAGFMYPLLDTWMGFVSLCSITVL